MIEEADGATSQLAPSEPKSWVVEQRPPGASVETTPSMLSPTTEVEQVPLTAQIPSGPKTWVVEQRPPGASVETTAPSQPTATTQHTLSPISDVEQVPLAAPIPAGPRTWVVEPVETTPPTLSPTTEVEQAPPTAPIPSGPKTWVVEQRPPGASVETTPPPRPATKSSLPVAAIPAATIPTAANKPARQIVVHQPRPSNRRYIWLTLLIALVVLLADQISKWAALRYLEDGVRVPVLGDFFGLQLLRNPGAALGIGYGYTWVLTIVVLAVLAVLIRVIRKIRSTAWAIALGLLLGGALGNLIDRLFREPGFGIGHVIDFIAYWNWFIGNVADIAIVVAAIMVVIFSFLGLGLDGQRIADD